MEQLAQSKQGKHPLKARSLDRELENTARKLTALGEKATPALKWYATQKKRPLSVRLYAVATMGLIGDLRTHATLKTLVRDKAEDPGLRSAALQAIAGLKLPARERWRFLEEAAATGHPETVRREAFVQLAVVPGEDADLLEAAAKRFGAKPKDAKELTAGHAIKALQISRSNDAEAALFRLLSYFHVGHSLRAKALTALSHRRLILGQGRLGRKLGGDEFSTLTRVIFDEKGELPLQAARLLGSLADRRATKPLIRVLRRKQDPALVTAAALSLKAIGDPKGVAAVNKLLANLVSDTRFRPAPGKPDPRQYALQVRRAAIREVPQKTPPVGASYKELLSPASTNIPFSYQGWPGVGRPRPAWQGKDTLTLRVKPDPKLPPAAHVTLDPGSTIRFSDSTVLLITPGRARAEKKTAFDVLGFGAVTHVKKLSYETGGVAGRLTFNPGDTIEILSYRASGECFLRKEGDVFLGPCPQNLAAFRMLEEQEAHWWLHTRLAGGEGWFWADQPGITFKPRKF
jgi:HEAT repeat protein